MKVMSALNTKYLIFGGDMAPVVNEKAYGTAWFVDGFVEAATPDDEIGLIETTDLRTTAIVSTSAASPVILSAAKDLAPKDTIYMTYYSPNELHYHYVASADRAAVFSEVYYPDWNMTIDGAEGPEIFRADWILRGAVLPSGEHDIVMRFSPKAYSFGERVSRASSAVLFVLMILAGAGFVAGKKKEN